MAEILQRWEWRTFAQSVHSAVAVFDAMTPTSIEESDELYLLVPGGDTVKVRYGLIDIKVLRETNAYALQRWEPILKAQFPLDAAAARTVFEGLRTPLPSIPRDGLTLDAVVAAADSGAAGGLRAVPVHKRRIRYAVGGCQAERSVIEAGATAQRRSRSSRRPCDGRGRGRFDRPTGLLQHGRPEGTALAS